jgi:hypothetical protein
MNPDDIFLTVSNFSKYSSAYNTLSSDYLDNRWDWSFNPYSQSYHGAPNPAKNVSTVIKFLIDSGRSELANKIQSYFNESILEDKESMIKMELRCPDFWFKVGNINNLEILPRMITYFDESDYVEDFGSDDEDSLEDFYFKCRNKEKYFCRFENFKLNKTEGLKEIARWAEQILFCFADETFHDFMSANNINDNLLNEDSIEVLTAVNRERKRKIRENSYMELVDEDFDKIVGYYNFEAQKVIKI